MQKVIMLFNSARHGGSVRGWLYSWAY